MFREKFIIRSTMSQNEIQKKLKENVTNSSIYSWLLFSGNDYKGKIDDFKFEIIKILNLNKNVNFIRPIIRGEIVENYIFIEMEVDIFKKWNICITYLTIILIITVLVAFFSFSKNRQNIDFWGILILPSFLCFLPPFAIKMAFYQEKEHLKELFSGTIEK